MGCPGCGVVARGHGRDEVELVDAPAFGAPVRIRWRKRRWVCLDTGCPVVTFVEQDETVAVPRAKLTSRACRWAIEQIRREHASVNGVRRQLGTSWSTVWTSIEPILAAAAADESRFEGVRILGVDEHVWHHVSTKPVEHGGRGPKELTGMVDLSRDEHGPFPWWCHWELVAHPRSQLTSKVDKNDEMSSTLKALLCLQISRSPPTLKSSSYGFRTDGE
jgi:transposase